MELFNFIENKLFVIKDKGSLLKSIFLDKKLEYKYYSNKFVKLLTDKEEKLLYKKILGEGTTPFVRSRLFKSVYYKLESLNPSGSFKDRETSFTFKILDYYKLLDDIKDIYICSSGNAAISTVLYGNYYKKRVKIFLSRGVSEYKIGILKRLGADIQIIGDDYEQTYRYLIDYSLKQKDGINITTGYLDWKDEANKLISFELNRQIKNKVIDYVIVPVGNGSLLFGIWKGFRQMYENNVILKMPKIYGVQVENGSPFKKYFHQGEYILNEEEIKDSKADGILARESYCFFKIKYVIEKYNDIDFCFVNEEEIEDGFKDLLKEGILGEYTSSVVLGAYKKLLRQGNIKDNNIGVLIVSGSGLKML